MTKYYKQVDEAGELVLLLTYNFQPRIKNPLIVEISQEEYETMLAELESVTGAEKESTDEVSAREFVAMLEEVL